MSEARQHEFEGKMYSSEELSEITGYKRRYIDQLVQRGLPIRRRGDRPVKRFLFRGEMRTAKEISQALGASKAIIYSRLAKGTPVDQPLNENRKGKERRAMLESGVHEIGASNGENGLYWEDDLEARVWHLYCGGDEFGELKLAEIAELWSISRERVRQVENEAIRKIRRLAERGDKDALAAKAWFEMRAEQRCAERPGVWEQAAMNAPGNFELTEYNETVSVTDIAQRCGDDRYAQRPDIIAAHRGARRGGARKGRAA